MFERRKGFEPRFAATGIGSLPHLSVGEAVADVLTFCPEFPYWPQLPRLSAREEMYRQFSAGLPGLRPMPGPSALQWRRDEALQGELERVYKAVLSPVEDTAWTVSREDAGGLWGLEEALRAGTVPQSPPLGVKGQITGPTSLGLAVTGESGRALLYEEDLMDGVTRALALRARWQERFLGEALEESCGATVLISLDEPYLGTFGSAFFPYRPETVRGYLQIFEDTLEGLWGVHCCANTDWEFLLETPVGFVSFDAYAYGDRLVLYPEAVKRFLAGGRAILWGIVPTAADALAVENAASLTRRLRGYLETLVARGVPGEALSRQGMITPACGLAGLSVDDARRAMSLTFEVSTEMRENWEG